jgi:glycosyltransferase involved in cell wall biosynthesis
MVPVEAQACGAPVVALRSGGACETVQDGITGVLVDEASARSFADGIARLRSLRLDPAAIRANAEQFSRDRFMTGFQAAVSNAISDREAAQ